GDAERREEGVALLGREFAVEVEGEGGVPRNQFAERADRGPARGGGGEARKQRPGSGSAGQSKEATTGERMSGHRTTPEACGDMWRAHYPPSSTPTGERLSCDEQSGRD